jgi:hypothetical protein
MNIVSKRNAGLGDMLTHLAHCLWFSNRFDANLFVDWRYTNYHDKGTDKSDNYFGSSLNSL